VRNPETALVVEEFPAEMPVAHYVVANQVVHRDAIESELSQVPTHVASDVEEQAAVGFEARKKGGICRVL
jgi:hypothetical protein